MRLFFSWPSTDVPSPPGRPLVHSFTSRSVNLSWTPPARDGHSAITHYLVQRREGEGNGDGDGFGDGGRSEGNGTTHQVNDLRPFTTYSFRVAAVNAVGRSDPSPDSYYTVTLRTGKFASIVYLKPPGWPSTKEKLDVIVYLRATVARWVVYQ